MFATALEERYRWILFNRNNSIQISKYVAIKDLVDFPAICGQHPSIFSVVVQARQCTNWFWIPINMTRPALGVWFRQLSAMYVLLHI